MKEIRIRDKQIFIVSFHNEVLEAWEMSPGLNVFSLDFHTDTREAFHNYSFWRTDSEVKAVKCTHPDKRKADLTDDKIRQYLGSRMSINQINENLKHDEHIDFAVRTNLVNRAFILSTSRNERSSNANVFIYDGIEEYQDQRIIEYSPLCIPDCNKRTHIEECQTLRADSVIEDGFLGEAVTQAIALDSTFFEHYILDIDCDYFNTDKSLLPGNPDLFKRMINEAEFLTIAIEPECVKICRHKGCELTGEMILNRLINIIEEG